MSEKRQGGVQCIGRTIRILEFIASRGKVGSTEISRELELHVATVHNILCELVSNHYLVNVGGQYVIGPGVTALLSHYNPQAALGEIVRPYLQRLVEKTTETASATVMVGDRAHLIGFEQSRNSIGVIYPCWVWDDPFRLATATLLVSQNFSEERKASLYERLKYSVGQRVECDEKLKRAGELKYVIKDDAGDGQQVAIAVGVYSKGGLPVASIGISIPVFRVTPQAVNFGLKELIVTAREISASLGSKDPYENVDLNCLDIPDKFVEK